METLLIPLAVIAAFLLGIWFAWDDAPKKNSKKIEAVLCSLLYSTNDLPEARKIIMEAWRNTPYHELPFDVIDMINSNDTETFNSYAIEFARDLNASREVDII